MCGCVATDSPKKMFEQFSIAFTGSGLLLALFVPLLLTLFLRIIGRGVPPACEVPGMPAGIGGLLLGLLFFLSVDAMLLLFELGRGAGEVARVISMDADFAWPAIKTIIPGAIVVFALLAAIMVLTIGRSRAALWTAVVLLWVAGPGGDFLKAVILGIPVDVSSGFAGISTFTILATIYLLFSNRSAFTYGLSSAKKIEKAYLAKRNLAS